MIVAGATGLAYTQGMPVRTYEEAIAYWYKHVNYEQRGMPADARVLRLDRMRALLAELGHPERRLRILHAQLRGQRQSYLDTLCLGDPSAPLQILPGHVKFFRPDQAEYIPLATVFAYQCGGQPQPTTCLDFSRDAEYRRRQEVHFVVNDQSPRVLIE